MAVQTEDIEEVTTNRLEAFSDGVFAIAITLLILQLKLPPNRIYGDASLKSFLLKLWPEYFAFGLSFLMIGTYWANHHYIFKFYVRTDHFFIILNLFFLMTISFLPFPTAVLGEYINDISYKSNSVTYYAIGLFLPALFWSLIWLYANYRQRLIDKRLNKKFIRYLSRLYIISTLLYLSSIIISLYYPLASIAINILLTVFFMLPPKKPAYDRA